MSDFNETPNEAYLRAENVRLKAENAYLKENLDLPKNYSFTPLGITEEFLMTNLPEKIELPCVGEIAGFLRHNTYHVLARLRFAKPEDLVIKYYADGATIKSHADYAINELFPFLHRRFISELGSLIRNSK